VARIVSRSPLSRNPHIRRWAGLLLVSAGLGMLVPAHAAGAQRGPETSPPSLPSHASSLSQFVPPGWTLEQKKTADLDGDHRADALLLLRHPAHSGTPLRIVAIALRRKNGYELAASNSQLIPHTDDPNQEDPMADGDVSAQRRGFSLKLTLMSGAGSYEMATIRYQFRFQNGCFRLIGYQRLETNRNTLRTRDVSINFLTGAVIHRTGNAQSSSAPQETRDSLKSNPRLCLRDLGSAAEFKPQ
jgi:hypothetical protein